MAITYDPVTSSVNAKILFDGYEIGELQDFAAQETYNVREVYGCGTTLPTLVPGFFSGVITSRKAYIDINLYFTMLQPMSQGKVDSWLSSIRNALSLGADFLRDTYGTVNRLLLSYSLDSITDSMLKVQGGNQIYLNLFDIEVKDISGTTIHKYNDCVIDARKISASTGTVIILEDLTIKYKSRD